MLNIYIYCHILACNLTFTRINKKTKVIEQFLVRRKNEKYIIQHSVKKFCNQSQLSIFHEIWENLKIKNH